MADYTFTTPVVQEAPIGKHRLFYFYKLNKGVSIAKSGATYSKVRFPLDEESQRATTMAENARATLMGLWKAPTQANIANTKWAAYNAFVEYSDWASPLRGKNEETLRAERIITGAGDRFKNKVLALL